MTIFIYPRARENPITSKKRRESNPAKGKKRSENQGVTQFRVKKESVGFELRELGELTELGGELSIHNLEKVATKEEATEAKLVCKRDLKELRLVWGKDHQHSTESDFVDALQPHPNLGALSIINHGGTAGPSWLCGDISIKMLRSLHLEGVCWVTLPPFEQLPHLTSLTLRNIYKVSEISPVFGGATNKRFLHLKQIILDSLPELIEWVGVPNAHSFSRLETIYCSACPNLRVLPFLRECSAGCYNHLSKLVIFDCPKLSLPPMPHSSTLIVCHVRHSSTELTYSTRNMDINRYSGELALHNLQKVETMRITDVSHVSLTELSKLKSLRRLDVRRCNITFHGLQDLPCLVSVKVKDCGNFFRWPIEAARTIKAFPASLRTLEIEGESGMQSMALLSNLTCLTDLRLVDCENLIVDGFNPLITVNLNSLKVYNRGDRLSCSIAADLFSELAVARTNLLLPAGSFQLKVLVVDSISAVLVAPICSLLTATLCTLNFMHDQRAEVFTEEEDRALQLLTSLRFISFDSCPSLSSLPQGLDSIPSLKDLFVRGCPQIRSVPKGAFSTSLMTLCVISCSPELRQQAQKSKTTRPDFQVFLD